MLKPTLSLLVITSALALPPILPVSPVALAQAIEYQIPKKSKARGPLKLALKYMNLAHKNRENLAMFKLNIERAAKQLARAKAKDPSLNLNALESQLKAMEQEAASKSSAQSTSKNKTQEAQKLIQHLMGGGINTNWTSAKDSERIDKAIKAYKAKADTATQYQSYFTPGMTQGYHIMRQNLAKRVDKELAQLQAMMKHDRLQGQAAYNQVAVSEAYWYAAAKVFPQDALIQKAYQKISGYYVGLGGRKGTQVAKNAQSAQAAAGVKMPPAQANDTALETQFKKVFEAQGWNEPVLALRLISDWWPVRNKATGVLMGRKRDAAIATKQPNNCRLYDFTFFQTYDGKSYTAIRRSSHSSKVIACENIPQ